MAGTRADAGRALRKAAIRTERMRASPFAFLRGAPAVMATDLASTAPPSPP